MKLLLALIQLLTIHAGTQVKDSVNVRIYNEGKYNIEQYIITVDNRSYVFKNIAPHSFSIYQKLPYLYNSHKSKISIIKKSLFNSQKITLESFPMDHVGEKEFNSGLATLNVNIQYKERHFSTHTFLKKD